MCCFAHTATLNLISFDHRIPLKKGNVSINIRPYRYSPAQKDAIVTMVRELLDSRVIRLSNRPFSSPTVMVKKKDGSWRMCIDYRHLNKHTVKDNFPIPIIKELIDELHGSQVFSKLDLRSGYHQIRMCDNDAYKIDFKSHKEHYEFVTYGQKKIVNKCLETYLRCMSGEKPNEGVKWISLIEYWHNINFHTAIDTTLYEFVYGQSCLRAEAVNTACYVIERSPSTAVELKTPMEMWMGKPVNNSDLHTYI
nr:RNA-directed DNA polymerase [Tanacetum cinerariifolium]